jgi:hypothetical protein
MNFGPAQFATITPYSASREGRMIEKPITKTDSGSQTDTHFHESNLVKVGGLRRTAWGCFKGTEG